MTPEMARRPDSIGAFTGSTAPDGVSVMICAYNSRLRLEPTLTSLKNQVVPVGVPWEVVLVDNASSDGTAEFATRFWGAHSVPLRVVRESTPGQLYARRTGMLECRYEFISWVDDDNWVANDWVDRVQNVMRAHSEVAVCGSRSEAVFECEPPPWFAEHAGSYAVGLQAPVSGDVTERGRLWGAGMSVRRAAWAQLHRDGFQEKLTGRVGSAVNSGCGEDGELCEELVRRGWRLWYDERLVLQHYMPAGRLTWNYCRNLYRGFGRGSEVLDRYARARKGQSVPNGRFAEIRHWLHSLALNLLFLARQRRRILNWKSAAAVEGDSDVVRIEFVFGALAELLKPIKFWGRRS